MCKYRSVMYEYPKNYWFLAAFTFALSFLISYTTAHTPPGVVLLAAGSTAFLVICLTCYATRTDTDIT